MWISYLPNLFGIFLGDFILLTFVEYFFPDGNFFVETFFNFIEVPFGGFLNDTNFFAILFV